jgi:hypothetical protein
LCKDGNGGSGVNERLREKARELASYIGFDSETSNLGYEEAIAEIYSALLSERDMALEEAAVHHDTEAARYDAIYESLRGWGVVTSDDLYAAEHRKFARQIRSLKSKQ